MKIKEVKMTETSLAVADEVFSMVECVWDVINYGKQNIYYRRRIKETSR